MELHEPPDLATLDTDEQCKEVYAWAGLALYQSQVVESGLLNVLFLATHASPSGPGMAALSFFDDNNKKTMGQLVRALYSRLEESDEFRERLEEGLRRRNFVVHHFFRERAELFLEERGRVLMLSELCDLINKMIRLSAALDSVFYKLGGPVAIDKERVGEEAERMSRSEHQSVPR